MRAVYHRTEDLISLVKCQRMSAAALTGVEQHLTRYHVYGLLFLTWFGLLVYFWEVLCPPNSSEPVYAPLGLYKSLLSLLKKDAGIFLFFNMAQIELR